MRPDRSLLVGESSCAFAGWFPTSTGFGELRRFLFEREPLGGYREVACGVVDRLPLEEHPKVGFAFGLDELPHGTVNEPAPVGSDSIQDRHGLVWQDDVDAFAHDGDYPFLILHTKRVYAGTGIHLAAKRED